MGRSFNIGSIPTTRGLPAGHYTMRIAGFEEAISQNTGILMYKLELRAVEPKDAANKGAAISN